MEARRRREEYLNRPDIRNTGLNPMFPAQRDAFPEMMYQQNLAIGDLAFGAAAEVALLKLLGRAIPTITHTVPPGSSQAIELATGSSRNFSNAKNLIEHYGKHGRQLGFQNADDYLAGARNVIDSGIPVDYLYKGAMREGYVKFLRVSSKGESLFQFVGTNSSGSITTYHIKNAREIWKMVYQGAIK